MDIQQAIFFFPTVCIPHVPMHGWYTDHQTCRSEPILVAVVRENANEKHYCVTGTLNCNLCFFLKKI
jgi:hypothetical protein